MTEDVRSAFSPHDEDSPGTLEWVQAWYALQCDGDREHDLGIDIGTLDNPGWTVKIDLKGTGVAGKPLARRELHRSHYDWLVVWRTKGAFEAACGPLNLGEALHTFRVWATGDDA